MTPLRTSASFPMSGPRLRGAILIALAVAVRHAEAQQPKLVADTGPLAPAEQLKKFHLPPGFRIELVSAEPQTPKPININFDRRGRLLATCSVEYPFPAPPDRPTRDTIRIIRDTNGDGAPDTVSTFAEGLNIPIGVVSVPGGVFGYSIPNIWRFPDRNDDGVADARELAYGTFGFGDTHGMSSSYNHHIDGWVYACHGFSNTSSVKGTDGQTVTMSSGNTYRFRPDGSRIEQWTHGQVNPFGMTFDQRADIFTADCHTKPVTMLLRGGQYPMFAKPHDGLGFAPGIMEHGHESTGVAGVAYYDADLFPAEYRHNLFIGNPVTGRINRDTLEYQGSSPRAVAQPDFLTCDDPWFRPVDIRLGPDGALYVADFYNRIIGHYEVPLTHPQRDRERGRIWRVSYVGEGDAKPQTTPALDVSVASLDDLISALAHPNIVVRTFAVHELVHRIGKPAIGSLAELVAGKAPAIQRVQALWALHRLGGIDATSLSERIDPNREPSPLMRLHAVKALAEIPEWTAADRRAAFAALSDHDPFVRRAAVDAVGRHPDPFNVSRLLALREKTPSEDAQLVYSLRMALRDTLQSLGNLKDDAESLRDSPVALDHLADVAPGIHTEAAARFVLDRNANRAITEHRINDLIQHVGRYGDERAQQELDALVLRTIEAAPNDEVRRAALRALRRVRQEKGRPLADSLSAEADSLTARLLSGNDEGAVRRGLELARELGLVSAKDHLAKLALPGSKHPNVQPDAWDALAAIDRGAAFRVLAAVVASGAQPAGHRQRAIDALGNFNTPESRELLVSLFKLLPQGQALAIARALSGSKDGAEALLAAIEQGHTSPRVLQDLTVTKKLEASGVADREKRVGALLQGLPPEDQRIAELIAARASAFGRATTDAARGMKVFEKSCAACHKLGALGQKVGPELEGIGIRGPARLLEDLLDPNRNVDAAFRATILTLNDGRVVTGLVLREEGKVLVVVDDKGKELRLDMDEIDERKLVKLSPMPANLAETISEAELHDLLRYLLDQQKKPEPGRG